MLPWIGAVLLVLLTTDAFATVFSPSGRGGPINRRQNRIIWALFRRLGARRDGSSRDSLLALGGPCIVVVTLAVWMSWLVIAFALIYYPFVPTFLFSPGSARAPALEALYFSAYTAATLGIGDMVPDTTAMRLVTPLQAFGGFALLSASVTYFLAVYRELIAKQTLASDIETYFSATDPLETRLADDREMEAFELWTQSSTSRLTSVLLSHFQYPVLHYFRASRSSRALPVQLGNLLTFRREVNQAAPADPLSRVARHPSFRQLDLTLEEYISEVENLFVPDSVQVEPGPEGDDLERAHQRILVYMLYR